MCLFIIEDKIKIIINFNIFKITEVEKFIKQKLHYIQDIIICLNCSKNFFQNYFYLHIDFVIQLY